MMYRGRVLDDSMSSSAPTLRSSSIVMRPCAAASYATSIKTRTSRPACTSHFAWVHGPRMHSCHSRNPGLTSYMSTTAATAPRIASPTVEAAGNWEGEGADVAAAAAAAARFLGYCWYVFLKVQLAGACWLPHSFVFCPLPAMSQSASSRLPPLPRAFASSICSSQLCRLFFAQHSWLLRTSL